MVIKYKIIWVLILLWLVCNTVFGQPIMGHYIAHFKKHFKLFGLLPHFQSSGFLTLNSDSTYHLQSNWESFSDNSYGTWKVFNDTLILYSDGNDLFGDEIAKNYAYSYGHSDSIRNGIVFGIYDLSGQKIPNYEATLYLKDSALFIRFDSNGLYTLSTNSFDSLLIKSDKYFKYQQIKVTIPVCCKINDFGITPAIRYFLLHDGKIKNPTRKTLYIK